jgi:kynurenine formamidase
MELIDLSMTMEPMWRWPIEVECAKDMALGDPYHVTTLKTSMHAFTHVDTPRHIELGRESIDEVDLDRLCGQAAVVDLTPVTANQEIDQELLMQRASHVRPGDIVLLKTCWELARDYRTKQYWLEAPYLHSNGVQWLAGLPVKAIGFDFPQDYVIREIPGRHPSPAEMPTHDLLLRKGVLLVEYLCNLAQITSDRVDFYVLPLKVARAEGACARAIALQNKP